MKKLLCTCLCLIIVLFSLTPAVGSAYEPNEEIKSNVAYLVSMGSDNVVLYSKNSKKKTQPCSLTKVVTAAIALESCKDPENTVIAARYNAVHSLDGSYCTKYGIKENDRYSLLDLVYIMMLTSANDAAMVIADYSGNGSYTEFVAKMNEKAKALGCKNTNFENPTGVDDPAQYTTAEDMAKLVEYAMGIPAFSTVAKTSAYSIKKNSTHSGADIKNDNPLLPSESSYDIFAYDYCTGVKTGYTVDAGYCTAATATKGGSSYLAITFEGEYKNYSGSQYNSSVVDTLRLFRWAFSNFKIKEICSTNNVVAGVNVKLSSDKDFVGLVPEKTITKLVPINVDTSTLIIKPIDMPQSINAPVKAGDFVCKAQIIHADKVIATINLVAYEDIKVSIFSYILYIVKAIFTNIFTIIVLSLAAIGVVIYLVYRQRNMARRRKNKRRAMARYNREKANRYKKEYSDDIDKY